MQAGLGVGGTPDAYRSEWRRWRRQGWSDVDASTDGGITTVTDHIWEEKQRHGVIFERGLPWVAGQTVRHTPRLWEGVCALL